MSNELIETLEALASKQVAKLKSRREQNRRDFPEASRMMDALARFNPRLIWAEEGGRIIGTRP